MLPNDVLRKVAGLRIEGYTDQEIAEQLSISVRAVERKLHLIRNNWKTEFFRAPEP
jgi:DNA-directed RNA polymerase specialized sigma24 family protein